MKRVSVLECGTPCRFWVDGDGRKSSKAVRSTALHNAPAPTKSSLAKCLGAPTPPVVVFVNFVVFVVFPNHGLAGSALHLSCNGRQLGFFRMRRGCAWFRRRFVAGR